MRSYFDIPYGAHSAQRLDIHLPECESFPVFIYFHGGGFESGDKGARPCSLSLQTTTWSAALNRPC